MSSGFSFSSPRPLANRNSSNNSVAPPLSSLCTGSDGIDVSQGTQQCNSVTFALGHTNASARIASMRRRYGVSEKSVLEAIAQSGHIATVRYDADERPVTDMPLQFGFTGPEKYGAPHCYPVRGGTSRSRARERSGSGYDTFVDSLYAESDVHASAMELEPAEPSERPCGAYESTAQRVYYLHRSQSPSNT